MNSWKYFQFLAFSLGFHVDKDTSVLINIQYINHSPELWESPLEFKPSRFVSKSEDGSSLQIKKPSHFLPYSLGCRSCPGFGMFDILTPFLIANLVMNFKISSDQSEDEMRKLGLCNFLSMKHDHFFSLNLEQRNNND